MIQEKSQIIKVDLTVCMICDAKTTMDVQSGVPYFGVPLFPREIICADCKAKLRVLLDIN